MRTTFKLQDLKPVWEITYNEGGSEIIKTVEVNRRFIREAKASGDQKFIQQMNAILRKSKEAREMCGVIRV